MNEDDFDIRPPKWERFLLGLFKVFGWVIVLAILCSAMAYALLREGKIWGCW